MKKIKQFTTINAYLNAANTSVRSNSEQFFISKISELGSDTKLEMIAVQKSFYQLNFILKDDTGVYRINMKEHRQKKGKLYFISPEHVYSWVRNYELDGYLVYFKEDMFTFTFTSFADEFAHLFSTASTNTFSVNVEEAIFIEDFLRMLRHIYNSNHTFKEKVLEFALLSLLYHLKGLYLEIVSSKKIPADKSLISRYTNLINSFFLREKKVSFYAKKLNITPNYLNVICKKRTGKNAKALIEKRVLDEAKIQLLHTDNYTKEIAYYLGFDEPSNFARFFKTHTGYSPQEFRYSNH